VPCLAGASYEHSQSIDKFSNIQTQGEFGGGISEDTRREALECKCDSLVFIQNSEGIAAIYLFYPEQSGRLTATDLRWPNARVVSTAIQLGLSNHHGDQPENPLAIICLEKSQHYDASGRPLYNYFRDYDPSTGRYIQSDPIGLAGGLNTYVYVGNNPVSYIDPLGLETTYDIGIKKAIARGDVEELKTLLEAANSQQTALIQRALTPARDLIRGQTRQSKSWAGELAETSYAEICGLARGSGELANKAKQMKKLIEQQERLLEKL
jgi:RHS repeat-associated protein